MIDLNPSRNLAARSCVGGCLLVLAGLLATVAPLRADSPPTYLYQIDTNAVLGEFEPNYMVLDSSNNIYVTDYLNSRVLKFAGNGSYLTQWGSLGSGNGQFDQAAGIALDSSNNFYVADILNNRVEKFDRNGNYLTQWGSAGSGNGQFNQPQGIAVDSSNNVYVADLVNNRVEKFDSKGNYLSQWGSSGTGNGQFNEPNGVAVDSSNNVYVADTINNRMQKFDKSGNYLMQWGGYGTGNGQFYAPNGVKVDSSNNVYVTDYGNGRVEKFDRNGNYLTQWGSGGIGNGQFEGPEDVAVDSTGNFIYVTDSLNYRIEVFVNNANIVPPIITNEPASQIVPGGVNVIFSVGVVGTAPFSYQWISNNIAVPGATNAAFTLTNVSLADSAAYSVLVTNSYGSALSSPAVLTVLPALVTTLPASGVSITGAVLNGSVTVGSDDTVVLFEWGTDTNYGNLAGITIVPGNNGSTNISTPLNALSANIYYHYRIVAENAFGTVYGIDQYFRADNPPTYLFEIDASAVRAVPGGYQPYFVALDSSNNVYVTDRVNYHVVKFDSNGNYLTQWGSSGGGNGQFNGLYGVAVDRSNNVCVTDVIRVEKFDSNGNYLTQWGSGGSGNGQFNQPQGIAVDGSNNFYVVDSNNNRVEKFDSNGNYLTQWGNYGSGNGQFNGPYGVADDRSNNVYVTDGNYRVEKFDSNGNYLTQWGSGGSGNGQFNFALGIAVDRSNNVYVTDYLNNRIEKFDGNGNYLTQWGSFGGGNGQFVYPAGAAVDSSGNFIYVVDSGNDRIQVFVNNANIVPPIITSQPVSQTVLEGVTVTFGVSVVGAASFAYQWMSNNVALPNATNSTFTLTNVTFSDSAMYAVRVTNSFGSTLSSDAVLTVVPGLVTTLPASSISATGAVLNATATLGQDETLVWFEWGTDTNYGNIAGVTDIPGGAGTLTLSNALNGLDGNLIYHYRVVAWNSFGIVYGSDQSFQVGFRPTIVTVFATGVTTNSATLNATVNPQGRDTTVYFRWGIAAITNSSPGIDIGSEAASLTASTFITNLTLGAVYHVFVTASNSAGTFINSAYSFQALPWNSTAAPILNWQAVASSADGSRLVAVPYGGTIWTSTNSGISWSTTNNPVGAWISVASSANGTKLVTAIGGFFSFQAPGRIYTSTNSGAIWTWQTNAPIRRWNCVASSADGSRLVAVASGGSICTSTDSGVTWTSNNVPTASSSNSLCIASSADGSRLVVAVDGGLIYTSTDAGSTWVTNDVPATNWQSVASSADGTKLAAAVGGYRPSVSAGPPGPIYTSANAGATWMIQPNAPTKDWFCVASSADGNKLVAVAFSPITPPNSFTNSIFISNDAGLTWTASLAPTTAWEWVASSADGSKLAAVANNNFGGTGKTYTLQTMPSPVLDLSASGNGTMVSWIIPSLNFSLEQSPDLLSWTDVTNLPVLNLTNLENQVVLPPPAGNGFFRLMH